MNPETLDALAQALDAVIGEAGDDPALAELVGHLQAAQGALPGGEGDLPPEGGDEMMDEPEEMMDEPEAEAVADPDAPPADVERDSDDDPYSFGAAEKKHKEKRNPPAGKVPA